jgi:hypothetical protein
MRLERAVKDLPVEGEIPKKVVAQSGQGQTLPAPTEYNATEPGKGSITRN